MNKRDFVLGGATTLTAGVVLPTGSNAAQPSAGQKNPLPERSSARRLTRWPDLASRPDLDTWRHYVGESFAQPQSHGNALVLQRVDQHCSGEQDEQFSLVFTAPGGAQRPVGTQDLRHAATGQRCAVFLQAAGHEPNGRALYRADFNRLG